MNHPLIEAGVEQLRTKWPQAHYQKGKHGYYLIVVPSVKLPAQYRENICTVLFLAPPGFPASHPDHFFTDIEIRTKDLSYPRNTNLGNGALLERIGWPQWKDAQWWSWHLQMWNPNQSSLYTYMRVIEQRFQCDETFR
jgi:hypothetical protein